ncbi:HI0074 family nucleotidyltransferase substrate-binding subunit [Litoribacter populi]|uniref:HI0074 family nucleotidyltransferase substrate-binding subunit n=1 Tax=Litoribacter populi TaxID=2598460 RepID=UPI00117FBF3D|nr:HI0074 family nucleotidyltransferase substrate-binding subunit [Litoribacter populi]
MKTPVVNWHKRLKDFSDALSELREYLDELKRKGFSEKLEHKIIRSFELTHEMALNTMIEYFRELGHTGITGPRDLTVEAFHSDLIDDGENWLEMIIDRIKASPLYNEDINKSLMEKTSKKFIINLENFERKMKKIEEDAS